MKTLVTTDFHGNIHYAARLGRRAAEEEARIIVICGDVTNFGTVNLALKVLEAVAEAGVPVLYVPGNCDPKALAEENDWDKIKNIHRKSYEDSGYMFMGLGGSSATPFHTLFELSEFEIENMLKDAYAGVRSDGSKQLVLISHSPPRDTKLDRTYLGAAAGSISVRNFVLEKKPAAVFCGHIHESRGVDYLGRTIMVNPGPAFRGYYAVVYLEEQVRIELKSL